MLEYRVGDKVRIKSRKWYNSLNRNGIIDSEIVAFGFNTDMSKQCGRIGIITRVIDCNYRGKKRKKYFLNIDSGRWSWNEEMFDLNKNTLEIE